MLGPTQIWDSDLLDFAEPCVERLCTMKRWDKAEIEFFPAQAICKIRCHGPPLVVNRINWISVPVFLFA
jgi:hypothetical protein